MPAKPPRRFDEGDLLTDITLALVAGLTLAAGFFKLAYLAARTGDDHLVDLGPDTD